MKRRQPGSLWNSFHRWCGALISLYVICIALTGVVLQYKDELLSWQYRDLTGPVSPGPETIEDAVRLFDRRFAPAMPAYVRLPTDGAAYYHLYLDDGHQALVSADDFRTLEHGGQTRSLLAATEALHTHLLIPEGGKAVVGFGGILMLTLLVSALYTWLPFARHTKVAHLRLRQLSRPHLNRFHRVLGLAVLPVAFLTVITGVAVAFGDTSGAVLRGLLGGQPYPPRPSLESCTSTPASLSAQIRTAEQEMPKGRLSLLIRPLECNESAGFRFQQPGEWHSDGTSFVYLDPGSLTTLVRFSADSLGTGTGVMKRLFPIHAGIIGEPILGLLLSLGGLILIALSITGLVAFLQWASLRRQAAMPARRSLERRRRQGAS